MQPSQQTNLGATASPAGVPSASATTQVKPGMPQQQQQQPLQQQQGQMQAMQGAGGAGGVTRGAQSQQQLGRAGAMGGAGGGAPSSYESSMILAPFVDPFSSIFGGTGIGNELGLFPRELGGQLLSRMQMPSLPQLKLDIKESESQYEILGDVPGVSKDQVSVEVDPDNNLHLRTEAKKEHREEGERGGWTFLRQERSETSASRVIRLPSNVDTSAIEARVDNGILRVVVPKLRPQAESRRKINVA